MQEACIHLNYITIFCSNYVLLCCICRQAQPQTGTSETDVSGSEPQLSVDGAGSYNSVAFSNPTQEVARIKAELGSLQTHLKVPFHNNFTYPPPALTKGPSMAS